MQINVTVITEEEYSIDIDVPEDKEDEVYNKVSCTPCLDDIYSVKSAIREAGYDCSSSKDSEDSRVEMWR